jgi:hypothetical protein
MHVFALNEIRGAAKLTCPRCARVFRFVVDARGNTRLVAPRPDIDVELVNPQELARPRAPAPVVSPAAIRIVPSAVVDVERHRRRKPGSRLSLIMGTLVSVLIVSLVLGGYFMFRASLGEPEIQPVEAEDDDAFEPPEQPHAPPVKRFSAAPSVSKHEHPGKNDELRPTEFLQGAQCEVEVPVGVWTKFKASEEDEQADLFLQGRRPEAREDSAKGASLLVVVLDRVEANLFESAKTARNRLEEQRRQQNTAARLVPANPPAEAQSVGDRHGSVAEYKLKIDQQPQKYILLAVVKDRDKVFSIRCECDWENRQLWQSEFREILQRFRIKNTSGN